jgi:RNA polymerase sigma-70 factor (ECF subfamily)
MAIETRARPLEDGDDTLLVARLRAGDAAALEALMARYSARVYRLAYGIVRNEADAEEVAQDVFLTLFRKVDTFEGRSTLWTWIFRVTTNVALAHRRGKWRELEVPLEEHLPKFLPDGHRAGDAALLACDWSATPEEEVLSGETRALLARAIDELPEDYRVVLVLRDVEGLSNEEAAGVVGETVACVKSRLHRARMALRERLTRHLAASQRPSGRGPIRW